MKEKNKNILIISIGVIIIITLLFSFNIILEKKEENILKLEEENKLYKILMVSDLEFVKIYEKHTSKAEAYYDEASFFYEKSDYNNVESNCRLAREDYASANKGFLNIKSELENYKIKDELIDLYIESLEIEAEIQWNMFEACEHFESAVRYYDLYFNTDVPYDDPSFDMADGEMDMMNEKIGEHDKNVREYNDILSKYNKILEKRLEDVN